MQVDTNAQHHRAAHNITEHHGALWSITERRKTSRNLTEQHETLQNNTERRKTSRNVFFLAIMVGANAANGSAVQKQSGRSCIMLFVSLCVFGPAQIHLLCPNLQEQMAELATQVKHDKDCFFPTCLFPPASVNQH
jgi:hypothetical protein